MSETSEVVPFWEAEMKRSEKRWRDNYPKESKFWARSSRRTVQDTYERHPPKTGEPTIFCPCCHRLFAKRGGGGRGSAYMMASYVSYYFPDNLWFVWTGFGSVIADCDAFVVADPVRMNSLLRRGLIFCDFCLTDLVESGVLRVVFLQNECELDLDLHRKMHVKGYVQTW